MKKSLHFIIALMGLTLLAGCTPSTEKDPEAKNIKTDQTEEVKDSKVSDTKSTDQGASVDQANVKLAAYVDCINDHSNSVLDSYARYTSWTDEATGPTGSEKVIYGVDPLYRDVQPCIDGLKKAKTLKPSYEALDKSADAYISALTAIVPLIKEANEYYSEENYKDDAMAKGKEMHSKLIAGYKAFDAADSVMRPELEKIQDELDVKRLSELEKTEGRKYAFLTTNAMVMAKKIANQGNVADLKEVKLDEFQKSVENYEKAVDELSAYNTAHKNEAPIGSMADSFISQGQELLKASKDMMRRVRDNTPYTTGELMSIGGPGEWMVNGSPGQLLREYNDLVNSSNSLSF